MLQGRVLLTAWLAGWKRDRADVGVAAGRIGAFAHSIPFAHFALANPFKPLFALKTAKNVMHTSSTRHIKNAQGKCRSARNH